MRRLLLVLALAALVAALMATAGPANAQTIDNGGGDESVVFLASDPSSTFDTFSLDGVDVFGDDLDGFLVDSGDFVDSGDVTLTGDGSVFII